MKTTHVFAAAAALLLATGAMAQSTAPAAPEAAPAPAAPAKKLSYTDDYRIAVNHDADSDGTIVFQVVTKKEGTTHDITATIKKGTNENDVARAIRAAFKEQLGTKGYSIEGEDGENVIIEGTGGKQYSLVVLSNTVQGVSIKIHHD